MAAPDVEMLAWLVSRFVRRAPLTHDERREMLHVARGLAAPESAQIERVLVEVIRTRRKAMYRKLGLAGSTQLMSGLLALALARLARPKDRSK